MQLMIAESHRNKIASCFRRYRPWAPTSSRELPPAVRSTVPGLDVKAVFGGHDRHAILSNCEAGEDAAQRAYKTALENEALPAFIRDLLSQQQQTLKESHDEIKSLRDQYA